MIFIIVFNNMTQVLFNWLQLVRKKNDISLFIFALRLKNDMNAKKGQCLVVLLLFLEKCVIEATVSLHPTEIILFLMVENVILPNFLSFCEAKLSSSSTNHLKKRGSWHSYQRLIVTTGKTLFVHERRELYL